MPTNKRSSMLALLLSIVAGLSLFTIGCSEDGPTGPGAAPMDEITVNLTRLTVFMDCDNNISFTDDAAGDFYYYFLVQVEGENGWEAVQTFPGREIKLNNGETGEFTNRSVTFRLPRENGQRFRVYTLVAEIDAGDNNYDFSSGEYITHQYQEGQSQDWKPTDRNYSSYSATTHFGSVYRGVYIRDQTFFLGIVTDEGCSVGLEYNVTIKSVS